MDTSAAVRDGIAHRIEDPAGEVTRGSLAERACAVGANQCEPNQYESSLEGTALEAWRSYLQSHAAILRLLDAELAAEHAITTRDYEVLLYLAQAPERKLPMSALAESTMLTRSGITRLVDGLVDAGLIKRVSCPNDARVSYAQLTDAGYEKLRDAGCTHIASIHRLFLEHFSGAEIDQLAELLSRLPGARREGSCSVE
jgi:DNA-binding MarR family transcriptional regulator